MKKGSCFNIITGMIVVLCLQLKSYGFEKGTYEIEGNFLPDTTRPINILSNDKMNIMVDYQKELIALQWKGLNQIDRDVLLTDSTGKIYERKQFFAGSTLVFFETQTLYEGDYILKIMDQSGWMIQKINIIKP